MKNLSLYHQRVNGQRWPTWQNNGLWTRIVYCMPQRIIAANIFAGINSIVVVMKREKIIAAMQISITELRSAKEE